ncbi:MAG: aldehyde dehydrogenase family protein [Acidimicrobiales bacterium]
MTAFLAATEVPEGRMLIDGRLVEARSGRRFENVNPATEQVIGQTADASPEDMRDAIAAARRAFDQSSWSSDHGFRQRCLGQLQAALREEKERLRELLVAESGSPTLLTYAVQVDPPIDDLHYWIEMAGSYSYEREMPPVNAFGRKSRRLVRREAAGVVGAVTPWNFPLYLNLAKLGPALAAGCTVVLKPAPDTPWSATELGRLVAEKTDIPPGVLNVVPSSDHLVGEVLSADPRVDMITFTGSTATGRRIMAVASATVKRLFLELGGKSAHVVLDDADFKTSGPSAAGSVCMHGGQGCAIATRMLLPRARYEEGVEAARAAFEAVPYGDPTDPSMLQGPQISGRQRDRILAYIETGRREARLVTGGGVPGHLDRGFYVEPTLFADVDPDATIAQEEIFGPVLALIPYEDDDDAVQIANNSIYGLSGSVTGGDDERALAVARRIRTGTVSVNGGMWFGPDAPFGGYRQSGIGRENGIEGFEEYLEVKALGLPG